MSLLLLVPDQPVFWLGIETLVLTLPTVGIQIWSITTQSRMSTEGITRGVLALIVVLATLEHAPFVLGRILLACGLVSGAWALAAGVVMVVIASMINAWVLLLEVQR